MKLTDEVPLYDGIYEDQLGARYEHDNSPCNNCGQAAHDHVEEKCLFQPTKLLPVLDYWIEAERDAVCDYYFVPCYWCGKDDVMPEEDALRLDRLSSRTFGLRSICSYCQRETIIV